MTPLSNIGQRLPEGGAKAPAVGAGGRCPACRRAKPEKTALRSLHRSSNTLKGPIQ